MRKTVGYALPVVVGLFLTIIVLPACGRGGLSDLLRTELEKERLVAGMQVTLLRAVEAEKSAVLSLDDAESQAFADEARAASAALEAQGVELKRLVEASGTAPEKEALASFERSFTEVKRLDTELLDLAVQNTNLKAERLWREAASAALLRFDRGLRAQQASLPEKSDVRRLSGQTLEAAVGAERMYMLLARHIVEPDAVRMQAMEEEMRGVDGAILDLLDGLEKEVGAPAGLRADYAAFRELTAQILDLSRRNTNVRSLALSIGKKRLLVGQCLADLKALDDVLQARLSKGTR